MILGMGVRWPEAILCGECWWSPLLWGWLTTRPRRRAATNQRYGARVPKIEAGRSRRGPWILGAALREIGI